MILSTDIFVYLWNMCCSVNSVGDIKYLLSSVGVGCVETATVLDS